MGIFFLLRLSRIITRRPPWELKAYKTPHSSVSGFGDFRVSCFSRLLFIPSLFSVPFFFFNIYFYIMNCQGQLFTQRLTFSVNNHFCLFVLVLLGVWLFSDAIVAQISPHFLTQIENHKTTI